MYKSALHQAVWFPYRPEQHFIVLVPLLIGLIVIIGATRAVKQIDIFTSFVAPGSGVDEVLITILLFFLCLFVVLVAARTDYFSTSAAIMPSIVTVIILSVVMILFMLPITDVKTAFVQAGISTLATLLLVGRIVPSGGVDLGELGTLCRRAEERIKKLSKEAIDSPGFPKQRANLVADIEALAKAIKEAKPEVVCGKLCDETSEKLEKFISRSKLVSDEDFKKDLSENSNALAPALYRLNLES